jgi:HPt (histidine-containing phosphotransfer) domain-containing protein
MAVNPLDEKFAQEMAKLWTKYRGAIFQRVDRLEAAALACHQGCLTAEQRQGAVWDAHKLAGSLGTFGFARGGELARQLEHLFQPETIAADRVGELVVELRKELTRGDAATV